MSRPWRWSTLGLFVPLPSAVRVNNCPLPAVWFVFISLNWLNGGRGEEVRAARALAKTLTTLVTLPQSPECCPTMSSCGKKLMGIKVKFPQWKYPSLKSMVVILQLSGSIFAVWTPMNTCWTVISTSIRGNNSLHPTVESLYHQSAEPSFCCVQWKSATGHGLIALSFGTHKCLALELQSLRRIAASIPFLSFQCPAPQLLATLGDWAVLWNSPSN